MTDLGVFALALAGSAITIGSTMIAGLRVERFARRYIQVPQDLGAATGLVIGVAIVASWLL